MLLEIKSKEKKTFSNFNDFVQIIDDILYMYCLHVYQLLIENLTIIQLFFGDLTVFLSESELSFAFQISFVIVFSPN